jgi:hypothetical protein
MELKPDGTTITAITPYKPQTLVYGAEVIELYPEPLIDTGYFKCPTAEDIAQAEQELAADRKLSYWDWLKKVLG